jgi:Protein of unknown function (DUF2939).
LITSGVVFGLSILAAIAAFFYWQSLKTTPQYSLASLVAAAKANDQEAFDQFVDTDAVVDDFVPQVTGKAAEIYGRGIPDVVLSRLTTVAEPLMPSIKVKARAELPNVIRRETERFGEVPFPAMVIGAQRYLEIIERGDIATITSRLPEHNFEVKMRRDGTRWKVIGVRDEELATRIAQAIGEQIIGAASGSVESVGRTLGIRNIESLLREVEKVLQ